MEDNANNMGQQKVDGSEWTSTIRNEHYEYRCALCRESSCSSLTFCYGYLPRTCLKIGKLRTDDSTWFFKHTKNLNYMINAIWKMLQSETEWICSIVRQLSMISSNLGIWPKIIHNHKSLQETTNNYKIYKNIFLHLRSSYNHQSCSHQKVAISSR